MKFILSLAALFGLCASLFAASTVVTTDGGGHLVVGNFVMPTSFAAPSNTVLYATAAQRNANAVEIPPGCAASVSGRVGTTNAYAQLLVAYYFSNNKSDWTTNVLTSSNYYAGSTMTNSFNNILWTSPTNYPYRYMCVGAVASTNAATIFFPYLGYAFIPTGNAPR